MTLRSLFRPCLAALAALALAFPGAASAAETVTLKFQAPVPPGNSLFSAYQMFADRVGKLSGGRYKIEVAAAGAVVPVFEMLDATSKGVLHGNFSAASYWVGRNKAATLFGSAPGGPFGLDIVDYVGWVYEGGGLALYRELYTGVLKRDVVVFPMVSVMPQVLGWFKRPIKSWDDLKGMKCRQVGIAGEVYAAAGMPVVNMPGGEIVPAGERGVIDCAEWIGPGEDAKMGFPQIWKNYYMPSVHEPVGMIEVLINGPTWRKLPADMQEMIASAATEVTFRYMAIFNKANADALHQMQQQHAVNVMRTPDDVHQKILESWDRIAAAESSKNEFFKRVLESQRAYARVVVPARRHTDPPSGFIANHYWPSKR